MKYVQKPIEVEAFKTDNGDYIIKSGDTYLPYTKDEFEEKYAPVEVDVNTKRLVNVVDILARHDAIISRFNEPKYTYPTIHKYPQGTTITHISEDDLTPNSINTQLTVMWFFIAVISVYLILSAIF